MDTISQVVQTFKNNTLISVQHLSNGIEHNENGPSYIEYYDDGSLKYERYMRHGKLHNKNDAAMVEHYPKDKPKPDWMNSNKPVYTKVERYFIDGVEQNPETFF